MGEVKIDHDTYHRLSKLRSTLEAFALEIIYAQSDIKTVFEKCKPILDKLRQAARNSDYPMFFKVDTKLHEQLIISSGMPLLQKQWNEVFEAKMKWLKKVHLELWPNLMDLYREHEYLLEAWKSGDLSKAQTATHQHIEAGWYRIALTKPQAQLQLGPFERSMTFIQTHYTSSLEVAWIARNVAYTSTVHLNRIFQANLNLSPVEFIRQVRMKKAIEILKNKKTVISELGKQVGYPNTSHFIREFKRFYGETPKKFLKKE